MYTVHGFGSPSGKPSRPNGKFHLDVDVEEDAERLLKAIARGEALTSPGKELPVKYQPVFKHPLPISSTCILEAYPCRRDIVCISVDRCYWCLFVLCLCQLLILKHSTRACLVYSPPHDLASLSNLLTHVIPPHIHPCTPIHPYTHTTPGHSAKHGANLRRVSCCALEKQAAAAVTCGDAWALEEVYMNGAGECVCVCVCEYLCVLLCIG